MTRRGDTLLFDAPPTVAAWAAAGGKKESEGPLASAFDFVTQDAAFGEQGCENWEQAESLLQRKAVELCLRKADIPRSKVDLAFAGPRNNPALTFFNFVRANPESIKNGTQRMRSRYHKYSFSSICTPLN